MDCASLDPAALILAPLSPGRKAKSQSQLGWLSPSHKGHSPSEWHRSSQGQQKSCRAGPDVCYLCICFRGSPVKMCPHTTKSGKPSLDRPSSRKPSLPDPLHPLLPWTWCCYWKWSPWLPRPDHRQPELAWPWVLRATDCGAPFPRRLSLCLLGGGQSLLATALMILLSVPLPCHVMDQWLFGAQLGPQCPVSGLTQSRCSVNVCWRGRQCGGRREEVGG